MWSSGWGALCASWTHRAAVVAVVIGLTGGGSVVLATGVAAAAPADASPGTAVPALGGAVALPSTGCLLGLLCLGGSPAPTPTPVAPTRAPTATPAPAATTTAAATPAPTAAASAGGCLLGLLCTGGSGLLGGLLGQPSGTATAPAAPGLCVLSCGVLSVGGTCVASLLNLCVGSTLPSTPTPGSGSPSSGATCVGTLCLLGSTCTASLGTTCVLGTVPGLPALTGTGSSPPAAAAGTPGATGSVAPAGTMGTTAGITTVASGAAGEAVLGMLSPLSGTSSSSPSESGAASPASIDPQLLPRADERVGLVSGLSFGHGLILWPLFGLLDLVALIGLVVVVRRRWTTAAD
jgi:hypothetical protein